MNEAEIRVDSQTLKRFLAALLRKAGVLEEDADFFAEALVKTELWGISSHGVIRVPTDDPARFGDRIRIVPNHACPVMNLVDRAWLVSGDEVVEELRVAARGAI